MTWNEYHFERGEPFGTNKTTIYPAYLIGKDKGGEFGQLTCFLRQPDALPDESNPEVRAWTGEMKPCGLSL